MKFIDYVSLLDELGIERIRECGYYKEYPVCIFWFDLDTKKIKDNVALCDGMIKILNNLDIETISFDTIDTARIGILDRIKEIKDNMVDEKLKKLQKDF